ncbi:hypothetical protein ACFL6Y_03175 [Elusimicrobiota bacterium]
MKTRFFVFLLFSFCLLAMSAVEPSLSLHAEKSAGTSIRPSRPVHPPVTVYSLIDSPTAEVLDYGSFAFTTRFFSNGGLLSSMNFGVFQRLMLGISMELDSYLGSGTVDLQRPEVNFKFRFYDGRGKFPASAIGFNSQGYRYNKATKRYLEKEKGLYLAFTRELFARGLEMTSGANIHDFESDALSAFVSASYSITRAFGVFAEYDNIRSKRFNRLNAGGSVYLSPFVQMGFHARDILATKTHKGTSMKRKPERIIDIRYISSF